MTHRYDPPQRLPDPDAMLSAAVEVAGLMAHGTAVAAAAAARGIRWAARRTSPRWVCLTGLFAAWPICDLLQGLNLWYDGPVFAVAGAILIASPFAGGLLHLRHRDRVRLAEQQLAWTRGEGRVMQQVDGNSISIAEHEKILDGLQEEFAAARRIRDVQMDRVEGLLEAVLGGLAAAYRVAGQPWPPDDRPHLSVIDGDRNSA